MSSSDLVQKTSVLLIENRYGDDSILSHILSFGYNVIPSKSEPDSIFAMLRDDSVGILAAIVDIDDALPLLRKIRKVPALEKFPVLVIIDQNSEIPEELLKLDVVDFIKRPYNGPRVLNRLKTAIRLYRADKKIDELERDELTGLYTRTAFLSKADFMRREHPERKYCLIGFDFDNFKASNTIYGQEKCDEFLSYTGHNLKKVMQRGIAGRFGGDQYVLFFDYLDEVDVPRLERISKEILESAPIRGQVLKTGIYAPVEPDVHIGAACDRAYFAIRDIKGVYGNNVAFYESKKHQEILEKQKLTECMEQALEEGQFQVYYQPKHETISRKIAGAEALVRWNHPKYGIMPPGEFIPLFEKNGFITKLDMFVLEQVCKDIKRWKANDFPLVPISVNVSRRDFLEEGCIERQIEIIDNYEIPHELLHMEVTESLYCEKTDLIADIIKKTQEKGFMIEMDDFGAGYSSLGNLSNFSLDILKLDISFVRNIKKNEIVIENIIKMAHRLNLLTVAEGAESEDEVKTLKSLGCDFIQGHFFSKPLPLPAFESYLRDNLVMTGKKVIDSKSTGKEFVLLNDTLFMAANEISEGLPGGFFSYHAEEPFELMSFNKELLNLYECESLEDLRAFTGNSFRGLVYKDDFERVQASIETQITPDNDIDYVEYRIQTKTGKIKTVRDFGRFVRTKKYGDIFYVFLFDMTEEENRKVMAEQAENASKAKNIFMANFAKEALPPMQRIIECTDVIANNITDVKVIEENLKKARKNEEYLLGFVNNLREFSDLENGEVKLSETATDITSAPEKIYALIEDKANEKDIKVEYWSEITSPYIYQDLIHTTDVVLNILTNAVKYTPKGGKIKFGIRQTPNTSDTCNIEFICEDSGIGISEEFLPFVYKGFTREDNEINRNNPSAGLGLNIAKSLLQLMHGSVEITSQKGKGTTVRTIQPHRYAKKEDINNSAFLTDNIRT